MPLLKIITHPSSFLRKKSTTVKRKYIEHPEFQEFLDNMLETMEASDGIGLAAPQVGKNLRVVIAQNDKGKPFIFVNPKIYRRSWSKATVEEGCLSVPGVYGLVKRHQAVSVIAQDRHSKKVRLRLKNMPAIVIQHEVDHLDGVLFIDKIKKYTSPPKL